MFKNGQEMSLSSSIVSLSGKLRTEKIILVHTETK